MYCTRCGIQLDEKARFCSDCGMATRAASEQAAREQAAREQAPRDAGYSRPPLMRSRTDAKVAGVCAGIAHHLDIDVTIVRILWLLLTIYPPGCGLIAYIVCWIAMPKEPYPMPAASHPAHSS